MGVSRTAVEKDAPASERTGHGSQQRCLADAWRTHEQQRRRAEPLRLVFAAVNIARTSDPCHDVQQRLRSACRRNFLLCQCTCSTETQRVHPVVRLR